jgi:hypothetical protein
MKTFKAITIKNKNQIKDDFAKYIDENAIVLNVSDMDKTGKYGWFIGSNAEINLKKKIEKMGKPLKEWGVKINKGILTSFNEAFIIDQETRDRLIAEDPKSKDIIKPILRGQDIKKYFYNFEKKYLLATNFDLDVPNGYPSIFTHLKKFKERLLLRDAQGKNWWNLRACSFYDDLDKEKIIYSRVVQDSQFFLDTEGFYITDNVFFLSSSRNMFLLGLLNSILLTYFYKFHLAGGILGGTGYEYRKVFLEQIPIVEVNEENQIEVEKIEKLVDDILKKKKENKDADTSVLEKEIDQLVYKLYGLTEEEIKIVEEK